MLAELRREEGPQFGFVAADLMRGDPCPRCSLRPLLVEGVARAAARHRLGLHDAEAGALVPAAGSRDVRRLVGVVDSEVDYSERRHLAGVRRHGQEPGHHVALELARR